MLRVPVALPADPTSRLRDDDQGGVVSGFEDEHALSGGRAVPAHRPRSIRGHDAPHAHVLVQLGTVLDQVFSNLDAVCDELVLDKLLEGGVRGVRRVLLDPVDAHQVEQARLLRAAHARQLSGRAGRAVDFHARLTGTSARQLLVSGSGRQGVAAVGARDAEFVREALLLVLEFPSLGSREAETPVARRAEYFLEQREVPDHAPSLEVARLLLVGLRGWPVDEDRAPIRPETRVHECCRRKEFARRHRCRPRPRR
jgi:hypothetical protein